MNELFTVEKILDKRINEDGDVHYLIKWQDYPESKSTWEPLDNLSNVFQMIKDYEIKNISNTNATNNKKTK